MTPQTKARKLIDRFISDGLHQKHMGITSARQCALILVDEIINSNPHSNPLNTDTFSTMSYWLEVKKELEKS